MEVQLALLLQRASRSSLAILRYAARAGRNQDAVIVATSETVASVTIRERAGMALDIELPHADAECFSLSP